MERLERLIDTFRADYPDADEKMLLEFAQHVRRILIDELREDLKSGDVPVKLSVQVHGQHFSAHGPRSYVEGLMLRWQELADAPPRKNITPGFNRMQLISGR